MAKVQHLNHPPILEAVLECRFSGTSGEVTELNNVVSSYVDSGWSSKPLHAIAATLSNASAADQPLALTSTTKTLDGIVVSSPEGAKVFQFRPNRLVTARVKDYTGWEDLEASLEEAFNRFVAWARPAAITRLGARFINRIPPPPGLTDYQAILTRPPQKLPDPSLENAKITNFMRRHVVEGLPGGFTANFSIGTVVPEASESATNLLPLVIDIDVFKTCELAPDFNAVKEELRTMRGVKNALFFSSLNEEVMKEFL